MKNKVSEARHKLINVFPHNPTQTDYLRFREDLSKRLDSIAPLEDGLKLNDRLKTRLWENGHD